MTEDQKKLSGGIARLIQCVQAGPSGLEVAIRGEQYPSELCQNSIDWLQGPFPLPPLSPLQTLALSVLIDPTTASTSALIDALIEAGVITEEWEGLVRADERGKVAQQIEGWADGIHTQAARTQSRLIVDELLQMSRHAREVVEMLKQSRRWTPDD